MTPPDSDAVAICPSCRQRLNGLSPSCRYSTRHYVRHYVKPDSGEREVIPCTGLAATWCPVHGDCTCEEMENGERSLDDDDCPLHDRHSTHCEIADDAFVVVRDSVSLPLSLAQRILAALDTHVAAMKACAKDDCGCGPLAAELRDRMPK